MRLKTKLAFEYAEDKYPMFGTYGEGIIVEEAYVAGFKKARELMLEAMPNIEGIDFTTLENVGEEEE